MIKRTARNEFFSINDRIYDVLSYHYDRVSYTDEEVVMWKQYKPRHNTTIMFCERLYKTSSNFGGRFHYYDIAESMDDFIDLLSEMSEFKKLYLETNAKLFECSNARGDLIMEITKLKDEIDGLKNIETIKKIRK